MPNPMQLMQMVQQLKGNPAQFLGQYGVQIQPGMNDPQQIVQQLLNSGRVTQAQVDQARQMAMQSGMFPGGAQRR